MLLVITPQILGQINDNEMLLAPNISSTYYFNISQTEITEFSFEIKGTEYLGSFPQNVSIDFGSDNIIEWEYAPYHSNTPLYLDQLMGGGFFKS